MEKFLITGGQGFIGSWIARVLLQEGTPTVIFDRSPDNSILSQVVDLDALPAAERAFGDITDTEKVRRVVEEHEITHVIHLAGLQVPSCRADPVQGARVNVIGTLNVFEAARAVEGRVKMIVYASSAAVAGRPEEYDGPFGDDARHVPRTHYGVFKTANEGNARTYFDDNGLPSVGLRPYTVYGVGREIGITSAPTKAIKAAVLGRRYTIPFSGRSSFVYAEDLASIFVRAARSEVREALALNVRGEVTTLFEFLEHLRAVFPDVGGGIDLDGEEIPIACDADESGLERLLGAENVPRTPLRRGIERTAEIFQALARAGRLHDRDLQGT